MKTKLRFLTEEGRTRSKNAFRRFCAYAVVMFLVAGAGAYVIHRYWVTINLTVMQRVYFKQYFKSTWRGTFANSRSQYTTLARTVIDPNTKKEVSLYVKDDEIEPVYDDDGHIKLDKDHRPILLLKGGIEHKKYYWLHGVAGDRYMYEWFKEHIYEGQSIPDIWRPAWLGAILIFIFGTIGLTILDGVAQRLYLKGEPIRGTKELSPKKYAREYRREAGVALKSYNQGSEI
jgi:hypothetical protein